MGPRDHKEHDEHQGSDSPPGGEPATGKGTPPAGAQVIGTDDPVIASGLVHSDWVGHPDQTTHIETRQIRDSDEALNPDFAVAYNKYDRQPHDCSGAGDGGEKVNQIENEEGRESRARTDSPKPSRAGPRPRSGQVQRPPRG